MRPTTADEFKQRDIRQTSCFRKVDKHFHDLISPSLGKVSHASDPELSPDGKAIAVTGSIWNHKIEGAPLTRVCIADVASGDLEIITHGPNNDRLAKWSPNGQNISFLSDRARKGTFHVYILSVCHLSEAKQVQLPVGVTAEYAIWSAAGDRILIGVAGIGADQAGGQGSGKVGPGDDELPSWMPSVEPDSDKDLWRSLLVYHVAKDELCPASLPGVNVWEATWCGENIAAIASTDPTESSWYEPTIELIDSRTGANRTVYKSPKQISALSVSLSGTHLSFVEGLYSDRGVVAGTVKLLSTQSHTPTTISTENVDASQISWIDDEQLFFIGVRGLHAAAGIVKAKQNEATLVWTSSDSLGSRYPQSSTLIDGSFAVVRSSWTRYPELTVVRRGEARTIRSLEHKGADYLRSQCGPVKEISWTAPDGLEVQGFLCLPRDATKPVPLVVHVHGGPVWAFQNAWQMMFPFVPILVANGYAVLSPNPRGSKGRGEEFAAKVQYDVGGADRHDILSGIQHLVDKGVVDTTRVGVTGGSYGGYMSTWLITQTDRFAASVAIAPSTEWLTQHVTSNIPKFDQLVLRGDPLEPKGQYYERSPLRYVRNVSTPLLQIAGSEDQCTPASQAIQFHRALLEHGGESSLAVYPGEGHGVRNYPAVIDYCTRMLAWFNKHMPADG